MKRLRYKIVNILAALITTYGGFRIYGIAGSSDLGFVDLNQLSSYILTSIVIIILGILIIIVNRYFTSKYNHKISRLYNNRLNRDRFIREMTKEIVE